jgi:hypothetical protein
LQQDGDEGCANHPRARPTEEDDENKDVVGVVLDRVVAGRKNMLGQW